MTALADMPLAMTVEEAAGVLRIGRSAAYAAARSGDLPVIRVGRCLRVPRDRLEALLAGRLDDPSPPTSNAPAADRGVAEGRIGDRDEV